jgi:hypothetical protein
MAIRFQFGLLTLFGLTTGLAATFGLIRWHPIGGTMLALLLVGGGWSLGAYRAGWHRLAYFLITLPLGLVAYMLLSMPLSPATFFLLWKSRGGGWPRLPDMLCMVAATAITAAVFRRRIRLPREGVAGGLSASAAYLGTVIYAAAYFAAEAPIHDPVDVARVAVMLMIVCPVITTFSLHLAWPMSMLFVWALRQVDPLLRELSGSQQAIVAALQKLGAGRPRLVRHRLTDRELADHLGRDVAAVRDDLEELERLGAVEASPTYGYRLYP